MPTRPDGNVAATARRDLRQELLEHAVALTREHGPDALSLREVQRRAEVSSAAAYRHYRDRQAIVHAVGRRASALLGDHIQAALDARPMPAPESRSDARRCAIERLRAGVTAYLAFMRAEPGLFRAVFLTDERPDELEEPPPASRAQSGRGPYQLLQDCLSDLVEHGVLSREAAPWSDVALWAATHGLAVLRLDGPLRFLTEDEDRAATERLLDLILAGLANDTPA